MFNVRHDFGFAGKLFGAPRAWLSKVGAFVSSFATRGNLINLTIPDNPSPSNAPVVIEVDESALADFVAKHAPAAPSDVLTSGDIGTTVAANDHNHAISDVTNLQTTLDGKAATTHNHDGVYQPVGNYAALATTNPASPRTYKNASGTVQSSAVGTAATAARADHVHLLPEDLLDTFTADQYITGAKHFRADKLIVNAAASGTTAIMLFKSGDNNTLFGRISSTASTLVLHRGNNSGADSTLTVRDGAVDFAKQGQTGQITFYYSGNILCRGMANNGGGIRFQFGNATTDTASIKETASGIITITAQNHARLSHQPITDTTATGYNDLQIATVKTVEDANTAQNPSSKTSIAPTTDAANSATWTAGGSTGLSSKKLMRVKYVTSGSTPILYAYYRTETYDKFGRLYSVSAETREIIDSTFLVNWS